MTLPYNCFIYLFSALLMISCSDDEAPAIDTTTNEGFIQTNPQSFPSGGGLDLDGDGNGLVAQLDSAANFEYDLKILAYRTTEGGRPAVFLYGDETTTSPVMALDVSIFAGIDKGLAGFNQFQEVTPDMVDSLSADGVFDFDPAVDVDDMGNPDAVRLAEAYANLVIGDKVVRLDETDQPVFLVQSREGQLYKFQHVSREGGGAVKVRWARLE